MSDLNIELPRANLARCTPQHNKTIKLGFVKYVEVDAEDLAFEYVGDDVFHVEECTGTEWLTFDPEKKKSFEPILDTVISAMEGFIPPLDRSDLEFFCGDALTLANVERRVDV